MTIRATTYRFEVGRVATLGIDNKVDAMKVWTQDEKFRRVSQSIST
jgi:hypothetical protein